MLALVELLQLRNYCADGLTSYVRSELPEHNACIPVTFIVGSCDCISKILSVHVACIIGISGIDWFTYDYFLKGHSSLTNFLD